MSTRRNDDRADLDVDQEVSGSTGPVRLRRGTRGATTRSQTTGRRKSASTSTRRKSNKVGGMHQRANKRTNW